MPNSIAPKQLNILHAEDVREVFESCRKSILNTFERENLREPEIENVVYCNGIFVEILKARDEGKVYDILLLDIELLDKDSFNGVNAIDMIRKNSPHTKIFVLSGKIYDVLYKDKLQEYKEQGKIAGFYETGNHEQWCRELVRIVKAKNVGILHFSDMHISLDDRSEQILSGFAKEFDEKTDLLIFSGDITNRGKGEEFHKAKQLLTGICDNLRIRKSVYVPGNHDIRRNTPVKKAFSNFLFFRLGMDEEYGDGFGEEDPFSYPDVENYGDYLNTVSVFPKLRTIVCGLNSATCMEDEKFGYDYGEITAEQLRQAEDKLKKVKETYPNYLVIGTFHHNIFEPPYYFDHYNKGDHMGWIPPVKNQGLILKKCFENEINLLLVGHSHVSSSFSMFSHDYGNGRPVHILSAGLFSEKGLTPLEPRLTVNYLSYQIDMSGNISDMYCQPYSLKLTDGNWEKRQEYGLNL